MSVKFELTFSEESRKVQFIENGITPAAFMAIEMPGEEFSAEERQMVLSLHDKAWNNAIVRIYGVKFQENFTKKELLEIVKTAYLTKIKAEEKSKAESAVLAQKRAQREAEDNERREFSAKCEAFAKEKAEAEEKAKESEIQEWIESYGSERLKLARKHGYESTRLYVQERAAIEYPGFILDFDDDYEWKKRVSPSLNALKLIEQYPDSFYIAWVKDDGVERDEYEEFEQQEAIVTRDFLGKYDLVMLLGDPQAQAE